MFIMDDSSNKKALAGELYVLLADVFTMSFRAQSAHWNVKGPDFHQYHGFFGMIYEDVEGSIDPTAENIRKLGFDAPLNLMDMCETTMIAQQQCACDPMSLAASLNTANDVVIARLNSVFMVATECNEQAIADFAASRLDMHQKWSWQLRTTLGTDAGMPGKSIADPLIVAPYHKVEDQQMVMFDGLVSSGASRKIAFSADAESMLQDRVTKHNMRAPQRRAATLYAARVAYKRGAVDHLLGVKKSSSHHEAGVHRVESYLSALRTGSDQNAGFEDADLLPADHPQAAPVTASAAHLESELTSVLKPLDEYGNADEAIIALAEFSGLGYDIVPSLRASWKRGVAADESGFSRAGELAVKLYDSRDADLLPVR